MSRLFSWLTFRLDLHDLPPYAATLWIVGATLLIVAGPVRLFYGDPQPALDARTQTQAWVWGLAFLIFVGSLRGGGSKSRGVHLWSVPVHAAVTFGAGFMVLMLLGVPTSRSVAFLSGALALALAVLPVLFSRSLWASSAALTVGATALLTVGANRPAEPTLPLLTALHAVEVREFASLVDTTVDRAAGGGLAPLDDGFLLVTSPGNIYRLQWDEDDGGLISRPVALKAPLNVEARLADLPTDPAEINGTFPIRALDMLVSGSGDAARIYLTHQYWNERDKCLTIRVSVADLPPEAATVEPEGAWTTIFESSPCVYASFELRRGAKGSRLAWTSPTTMLLSIGDHALINDDGSGGAQDPAIPYGKILQLDTTGAFEVLTMGHRNPQGLSVGRDGSVWSTEHGPQGGDEINYIVGGGNYGWPLATYGTQYGQESWPLAIGPDHGAFREPTLAFVPAVGISNLIHLEDEVLQEFPQWSSDLLVGNLKDRNLMRLRVRDGRVMYRENIPIKYRVRDLELARDGRIVLWADGGRVLVLSNAGTPTAGELAYRACGSCHGLTLEGTPLGPSLRGVVGRPIAATDFGYSSALRSMGGRWTEERLEAYVVDPEQFAPGNLMVYPGITEQETVFHLIEYLREYDP